MATVIDKQPAPLFETTNIGLAQGSPPSQPEAFPDSLHELAGTPEQSADQDPLTDDSGSGSQAKVQMVDGASHRLEAQAIALLRARLRSAAIVLVAGLSVFFLRAHFENDQPAPWLRGCVLINTVVCLAFLLGRRTLSIAQLRWIEPQLFLPVVAQMSLLQLVLMYSAASREDMVRLCYIMDSGAMGTAVMMLAYAMFMPNGWRRTALVLTPIAMLPPLTIWYARATNDSVAQMVPNWYAWELALILLMVACVGIRGTVTMAALRKAAQKAQLLGQYRLKHLIDAGGMGQVYLAEHQLLKRPCAVKLIQPQHGTDPVAMARFEQEVRSTARLSHWHTVEIFDYGHTEDGTFYYVMEYLRGMNLSQLVQRFGPLPPERVIHFLRHTCAALHEAHSLGLIHRDLKPANIFAARRGGFYDMTKLLDFGLVQDVGHSDVSTTSFGDVKVQSPIAGSPAFMSPEQSTAEGPPDSRSDIYALGASAYFLLTGSPPFQGKNAAQLMIAHARDPVPPCSKWDVVVPADLERIVLKCLAKKPEDRYSNVLEVEHDLLACWDAGKWTPARAAAWWKEHWPHIDEIID